MINYTLIVETIAGKLVKGSMSSFDILEEEQLVTVTNYKGESVTGIITDIVEAYYGSL